MAQQPGQPNAIGTVVPPLAIGTGGVPPPDGDGAFHAFDATDAVFPTTLVDAAPTGRNDHPLIAYPDDALAFAFFPATMDPEWGGVNLTLEIYWAAVAVVGDVLWDVAFERDNGPAGVDLDVASFAASKSVLSTAPGTTGELQVATLSFTAAEADGVTPGDPFRIAVQRTGGVGGDDLVGVAQLFRVVLGGPP